MTTNTTATAVLQVGFDPTTQAGAIAQGVLSSLPLSYAAARDRASDDAGSRVEVIDGSAPGWVTAVEEALTHELAGLIVVEPVAADLTQLLRASAATDTVVVVDSPWASNPVVDTAADAFRTAVGTRLECRVCVAPRADLTTVLTHQLLLVRALLGPVTALEVHDWSDRGYRVQGTVRDLTVDLSVFTTRAVPAYAAVRLLTADGGVELTIPANDTAQPARLLTVGPQGALLAPSLYESGHRASWRRLRTLLDPADAAGSHDLSDLHEDAANALAANTRFA